MNSTLLLHIVWLLTLSRILPVYIRCTHAAVQDRPSLKAVAIPQTTYRQADDRIDPLVKTLHELQRYAENGDIVSALQICAQMKKDGVRPDLRLYGYLCKIFADRALWPEVTALCHDAVAVGLTLDVTLYNWKLAVSLCFLSSLAEYLMSKLGQ